MKIFVSHCITEAILVLAELWCGSLSHRYFVKTAISHAEKIRLFFPLAKMLSLTRGNFP
jgi:hypothetical protein